MSPRIPSNQLSIYLIEDEYSEPQKIFKDLEALSSEEIDDVGTIYYVSSYTSTPSWINKFFGQSFNNAIGDENGRLFKIFNASSKAAFVVRSSEKTFIICFGYGHTLLNPGVWEERFGLKVVLNIIDPESLRSIDKINMAAVPKLSKEQIAKDGTAADFGIDIEQDLVQGITGKSKSEEFGQTITGKDALNVSVKKDVSTIKEFLALCYEKYQSDDYKTNFAWIDQVAEIKDPHQIATLNNQLIDKIKSEDFEKVWMSIPEIVNWENVAEFRVGKSKASLGDDVHLPIFLNSLPHDEREELSLEHLKNETIDCISANDDRVIDSWKAYNCLYCEIEEDEIHILSNGKWYKIDKDFANQVNVGFLSLSSAEESMALPVCKDGEHEDKYNVRVASEVTGLCSMDRKLISHGGGYSKIEFCDLLTSDKKILHVKRYGASSVLSHLFAQGLVSGQLFLSDNDFREKVKHKLPDTHKSLIPSTKPNSKDYEIIFAIISNSPDPLDIPFFSKANLRSTKRRLEAFCYTVSLQQISS